jgi:AhpD family alkylhydroperoxidase
VRSTLLASKVAQIIFRYMTDLPQRISYFPLTQMNEAMLEEMERCAREGTPRPESSAVRGHSELAFWAFAESWEKLYRNGIVDHPLKELCRVYVSRSVQCEYCGNQRSETARRAGLDETQFEDLVNFESSERYDERQKAALSYAEAITWRLNTDDSFWLRLHSHFTEQELVELAGFICLTMGQQSWIRLLNIQHHEVLAGSSAALAPGFESSDAVKESTSQSDYWAATSSQSGAE